MILFCTPIENEGVMKKGSFYEELEHVSDQFPKYHTNISLEYFNAKMQRKDMKPTTGKESLY
jgi:hypothetical protein